MIKYHGVSGFEKADLVRFLQGRNRSALVSFMYPDHISTVSQFSDRFIIDNGAFTHWKAGKGMINIEKYIDFCYGWYRKPRFEWAIIPDIIEGSEDENNRLIDSWPVDIPGAPVWHMNETLGKLQWLVDSYKTVCIGTAGNEYAVIGSNPWWRRMAEAMDIICDANGEPKAKIHGLRMLDPNVFKYIPLSSADSSNVDRNKTQLGRFKNYKPMTHLAAAEAIAQPIEYHYSPNSWDNEPTLFNNIC